MCMYRCKCVYIHIYMYTHIFTYIYIYARERAPRAARTDMCVYIRLQALVEKKSEFAQRRTALQRKLKGQSGRSEGLRGAARARDVDAGRRVPLVALVGYTNAGKSALQAPAVSGATRAVVSNAAGASS